MNPILLLALLLAVVFLLLIFPVKKRRIDFDEKGEAIKIYEEEVAHIHRQCEKGFIDDDEKTHLLTELDKKSALAIMTIEKKTFAYQRSLVPLVLIVLGLAVASVVYYRHYQQNGVMRWQIFSENVHSKVTEGLFDSRVVEQFISENPVQTATAYCFAMQRELLQKYDTNPDALGNLANCFISVGYPQVAEQAIERGLNSDSEHLDLHYLAADLTFNTNKQLDKEAIAQLMMVIKKDPNHFKAIRLLAVNSLNQGNYSQAKFFFTRLKALAPTENNELLVALDKLLGQIDAELAKQETADNANHNMVKTPVADNVGFDVVVKLAPELVSEVSTDAPVFIVVKSIDGQLLMASKQTLNEPASILTATITDNQAGAMQMQPMAGHQSVNVVARISKNSSPIATAGDLTSATQTVDLSSDKVVNLLIDTVVE